MINNLHIDTGFVSINKHNETLCGDNVDILRPRDNIAVIVLADGLGSGVKANILSILTSKILATMLANELNIYKCISTISSILPICKVREIAYSTFTAIKITDNQYAEILEYDNPQVIFIRHGKNYELSRIANEVEGKTVYISKVNLELDDTIITISDGAVCAGLGMKYNFGWQRENIINYIEEKYKNTYTSKTIAGIIVNKCNELYGSNPGDDTTACVIKVQERKSVNILVGPPLEKSDDKKMMNLFFSKAGKHIICGGTTATIASRYLNKPIDNAIDINKLGGEIPPTSDIEGVDLVTEGVITLNKVLLYLKDYLDKNSYGDYWQNNDDGASLITKTLIEDATDINFYAGQAINPAHQNPQLQIDFSIKMKLIEEVVQRLEKIGKKVTISYF